jgi:hypothetical protein
VDVTKNEDNLSQNSPGGYPWRFMGRPKGQYSNESEITDLLMHEHDANLQKETKSVIQPILEKVTQKLLSENKCTIYDINNGMCDQWAIAVEKLIPNAQAIWLEDLGVDIPHMVILYEGRYYDADVPQGVDDPKDLPISKQASLASTVLNLAKTTGGVTWNVPSNKNLVGTDNYAVAVHPDRSIILEKEPTEQDINDYIEANKDILNAENSLGIWYNKSSGKWYFDVVATLSDREQAIALGKANNQIAIFDLKNFVEVPTGGTGQVVKQAIGPMSGWLAPDGQFYNVMSSHSMWMDHNKDLLRKKYNVNLEEAKNIEGDWDYINWLILKGWSRVDGYLPTELNIQIADINNPPQALERFIWKYNPKVVILEDLKGNDIALDDFSKGLDKALLNPVAKQASIPWVYNPKIFAAKFYKGREGLDTYLDEGQTWTSPEIIQDIKEAKERFDKLGPSFTAYRTIVVDNPVQFIQNVSEGKVGRYTGVGLWWSIYPRQSRTFRYDAPTVGKVANLKGIIQAKDVDWDETIYAYLTWPEESGIKVRSGSSIEVIEIGAEEEKDVLKPLVKTINWIVTASLSKKAGDVSRLTSPMGEEFRVFKNPTPDQIINLLRKSKVTEHMLRYIATGTDVYVWDAYHAVHPEVANMLGLNTDPHWYDGAGVIYDENRAREVAERFQRHELELISKKADSCYTQQQMEEQYTKQHEYSDDPGGGFTVHDWPASSTDYPRPKDLEVYKCRLDQLLKPIYRNYPPGLPEYSITQYIALPADEYYGDY